MGKFNYFETCKRHYVDGGLLQKHGRKLNAGQLFGVSAECGIKALLVGLHYPTDPDGAIPRGKEHEKIRSHVNVLYKNFSALTSFASGRRGSTYLAMIPNFNEFSDWAVDHRYYSESEIPNSLDKWEIAAKEIVEMIEEARKDGVVK